MTQKLSPEEIDRYFADAESARIYPPLLTEVQAAKLLHLSPKTLANRRAKGELTGLWCKPGRHVLFHRNRLVAWASTHTNNWTA